MFKRMSKNLKEYGHEIVLKKFLGNPYPVYRFRTARRVFDIELDAQCFEAFVLDMECDVFADDVFKAYEMIKKEEQTKIEKVKREMAAALMDAHRKLKDDANEPKIQEIVKKPYNEAIARIENGLNRIEQNLYAWASGDLEEDTITDIVLESALGVKRLTGVTQTGIFTEVEEVGINDESETEGNNDEMGK